MPLYEYQCQACGHRFERIQKFSDAPPATCPQCGGAVEKLISSPAIQFKGSGFYLTDYGRGGKSDTAPGNKDGKPVSGDKGDKGEKRDKSDGGDKAGSSEKKDAPAAAASSGESGAAKPAESKPAAPASSKAD
jgi:putative FmdB family regulatory protein